MNASCFQSALVYLACGLTFSTAVGQYVQDRIDSLLKALGHPEAAGARLSSTLLARKELVAIGKPAVPKLIQASLDNNPTLAGYSAKTLQDIGAPALDDVKAVWTKLDESQKWRLMPFITEFDYRVAASFALQSLQSKHGQLRWRAIEFVGLHKEVKARATLMYMLNSEMPPLNREQVIVSLTQIGNEEAVDALIALLAKDSWAAKGIGFRLDESALRDERPYVIKALGKMQARKAAPKLLEVFQEKGVGQAYLGHSIIPLLGEWKFSASIPELRLTLTLPGELTPSLAAQALFQMSDRTGISRLLLNLHSQSTSVRRAACKTLANHGDKRDILSLGVCLDDSDEEVQMLACAGLERITGNAIRVGMNKERTLAVVSLWKDWIERNRAALIGGK